MKAYLTGNDVARRRFQLADRLARIYVQYLVYRADWLHAWAAGRVEVPERTFLAPLWRVVRERIGAPHRGERVRALVSELARRRPENFPEEPLHVFGISHMAPADLAVLRAVARHRLVAFYLPDPCIEFWGGLRPAEEHLRKLASLDCLPLDADEAFLELGHPLLASWGRLGQHLVLELAEAEGVALDVRHWADENYAIRPDSRLDSLQESMRRLKPKLIAAGKPGDPAALEDRSLRVHVCHTRLRELEVLRDALLRERSERPDLKPSDILVMAPNIQAYVPLIGAVFGEAGRHDGPLPYHLADVAVSRRHRLYSAFGTLLALPQSRLTAPEVMDLLDVPEIARSYGLDDAGIEVLGNWLARSRVAWGIDGAFRESFGVPGTIENTFAWGMDRLLAGYVFGAGGQEQAALTLGDGSKLVPVEGVHGLQAEVIGALDRLLQTLAGARREMLQPRCASRWASFLDELISTMFRVDYGDIDAQEACADLHRFARILDEDVSSALDPVLEFDVVREVLRERLAAVSERQRFLAGGVTFSGMVPQRAIPFEVIAVLGLNDGEFPREPQDAGLDLMPRYARIGDRGVRIDDRYLFLETLMAARRTLHFSYVGEGAHDGRPRNPATPLAELMSALDESAGLRGAEDTDTDRPWLVRHPLQPFDRRYFDQRDPRLYSFDRSLARLASDEQRKTHPFRSAIGASTPRASDVTTLSLAEVLTYYRDPARQLLGHRLNLRLDGLDKSSLRTSEPLDADFDRLERIPRRLFLAAARKLPDELELPREAPDWLRLDGLWQPGRVGERAYAGVAAEVNSLLESVVAHPLFADGLPGTTPVPVDRLVGGYRLQGELARTCRVVETRWVFDVFPGKSNEDALGFRERIALFLEWTLLRLDNAAGAQAARVLIVVAGEEHPWQDALNAWDERYVGACRGGDSAQAAAMLADLERRLVGLLAFFHAAETRPTWYFPKTSWEVRGTKQDPRPEQAWRGEFDQIGERDYAPGYAAILAGDACFDEGTDDRAELERNAHELFALIHLDDAQVGRD